MSTRRNSYKTSAHCNAAATRSRSYLALTESLLRDRDLHLTCTCSSRGDVPLSILALAVPLFEAGLCSQSSDSVMRSVNDVQHRALKRLAWTFLKTCDSHSQDIVLWTVTTNTRPVKPRRITSMTPLLLVTNYRLYLLDCYSVNTAFQYHTVYCCSVSICSICCGIRSYFTGFAIIIRSIALRRGDPQKR